METLPILKKNAYISLLIKDNHIFANLAYADFVAQRTYVLSDITDLSPLRFRMDDIVFNKDFWYEYFYSLEREFDWKIVDKRWEGIFKVNDFIDEGEGVSGIKVLVDDNQPFFHKIYMSLKEFSKDIALRVVDDKYMKTLIEGLRERLEYEDLMWIDMDLSHFTIFRTTDSVKSTGLFIREHQKEKQFLSSKIAWNNEIGLIDSIRNSKLQAFMAVETSSDDILDRWANFVAHTPDNITDGYVEDLLRSFITIQNLSLKQSNREKFEGFGRKRSAIIVSGKLPSLIKKHNLLLSIIDGLELDGLFDLFVDSNNTLVSYGKNLVEASESKDILVVKKDVLPKANRVVIPEVNASRGRNKVIYSGRLISQDFEQKDIYAINPNLEIFNIPYISNKVVVEGSLKNGSVLTHFTTKDIEFISSPGGVIYESLVVDCRIRPVIYGPKPKDNKIKLQNWNNGNKE
jgi:hypothetical protein